MYADKHSSSKRQRCLSRYSTHMYVEVPWIFYWQMAHMVHSTTLSWLQKGHLKTLSRVVFFLMTIFFVLFFRRPMVARVSNKPLGSSSAPHFLSGSLLLAASIVVGNL